MTHASVSSTIVAAALAEAGCPVPDATAAQLAAFLNLLERWNRVFNLTGLRGADELVGRHLVESLALAPLLAGESIADVGSGAGLPGMPLAAAEPARRFTLIEPRAKRCRFLRHAAAELGLGNVTVIEARAEDVDAALEFDSVVARAVAKPLELLELCRELTLPGGRLLILTSAELARGIETAAPDFAPLTVPPGPRMRSAIAALERRA